MAGASAQMKWSVLVDEILLNRVKLERKEISGQEYGSKYRELIGKLAAEIRSDPYRTVDPSERAFSSAAESLAQRSAVNHCPPAPKVTCSASSCEASTSHVLT